jgi:hypothetical protein
MWHKSSATWRLGQSLPPDFFWNLAQHVVDHPVRSGNCLAFVDWCRVAVAGGIGAINPLRNAARVPTFCCVDAALGHSHQAIRLQDLPQLLGAAAMMAAATPTAFQPIVEALAAIRTDHQTRADSVVMERAATVAAKASPARNFKAAVTRLLRICHVLDETQLPPIWSDLVAAGSKDFCRVFDAAAPEPPVDPHYSLATVVRPVITTDLAKNIGQLRFFESEDDLEGCLSIFATSFPNQASITAANYHNGLYDHHVAGSILMTLTEAMDLKKAQACNIPTGWLELRQVLGAHHHLLQILLGEAHGTAIAFGNLVQNMDRLAMSKFAPLLKDAKSCAELMFTIHTYMWAWTDEQEATATVLVPKFTALGLQFCLANWAPPRLPSSLWAMVKLPCVAASASPAVAHRQTTTPAARAPTTDTPLKVDTSLKAAAEHFEASISHPSLNIKALVAGMTPPNLTNGQSPCLNYHVRGKCCKGCTPTADHVKHTKEDTSIIAAYLTAAIPLMSA